MRTANPALNANTFTGLETIAQGGRVMTLQGTVGKSALLLAIVAATFGWAWAQGQTHGIEKLYPFIIGCSLAGLVLALITCFAKQWAMVTAPLYAAVKGVALGGISYLFEAHYPAIVVQAVSITLGTAAALLLAYTSGLIKPSENFKLGVTAATGAIFLVYMATWVLSFFGMSVPYIHESGLIGIGFSVFVVVLAAMNLVLDFDFIETGCERQVPKYMEWYAAFGLLVTLVWLYVEVLRLLAKLRNR